MSDNNDINFQSSNIKKKDIDFNVREKNSTKIANSLNSFWGKLLASPPLKGKNKFITLGVTAVIIAAAITLPIVLPKILASDPEPTPEEQLKLDQEIKTEVANIVNNVDPEASEDTTSIILADLDTKIANATSLSDKYFFSGAKANALFRLGRFQNSIDTLKPFIEELRHAKMWTELVDAYSIISIAYSSAGDNASAIEWMEGAISAISEAATDPESPMNVPGHEPFSQLLLDLKSL